MNCWKRVSGGSVRPKRPRLNVSSGHESCCAPPAKTRAPDGAVYLTASASAGSPWYWNRRTIPGLTHEEGGGGSGSESHSLPTTSRILSPCLSPVPANHGSEAAASVTV